MVTLSLTEKGGETKQLSFEKDEVTVGRVQGNDIVLPKGNVSKRHCRILTQNGRFSVEDLKSTNGTYINGRKIAEPTLISAADKIYVGDFVIKVDNAGESMAAPPGIPEAGSLSTALPRRPPPPPAPGRPTTGMSAVGEDEITAEPPLGMGRGRSTIPPPPPPPKSRENSRPGGVLADSLDLGPPPPSEIDLDDEPLAPRPRLSVPPLKSALASLTEDDEDIAPPDEGKTDSKDRGGPPAMLSASPIASARPAPVPTGSPDAVANWLKHLLDTGGASAVYVSGNKVEVERQGQRETADVPPGAPLADAIRSLASRGSPRPSADTRVVNVALPENARLAAIFPPVANEASATLQKVAPLGRSLSDLASAGVLSNDARELLEAAVATRRNILLAGDGRSTQALLQALGSTIPASFRVVSLVDAITMPEGAQWTRLAVESRVSDIVFAAASLRPDYLIAEVNSPPLAADVLTHSALGQEGTIVSVAGRSAADAIARLAALAGPAVGGITHVRELVATAFDIILCAGTLADGSVRLLELAEPHTGPASVDAHALISWRGDGAGGGKFQNANAASSRLIATLSSRGARLPAAFARR